ncbi:ADP-ribose pyrophosphatase YjhB (NUDIX family) [Stackebrandtia endophytica]|uniref:ADP-ribose pyrophosphatase YjhB (NUDIX family) n=1 Tax=Stackebrandtia endophytica TaxID=1496996 RepID=A0A543ASP9_9ACTN|nr:NUDIX hydrolase [Stackebrandtia endophytica]TQL75613.1 ADP-ribose pyrophosphatase YjhB (NUDIX family) [Stackebrandtia endophytica]
MPKELLPPEQFYASLATNYTSGLGFITNPTGDILLVKPNYRDGWDIPGGLLDDGESPHEACSREISEELGLNLAVGDLLVVDWAMPEGDRPRPVACYLFDCGTVPADVEIRLQAEELDDYRFCSPDSAIDLVPPMTADRLSAAVTARAQRRTVYLPTA